MSWIDPRPLSSESNALPNQQSGTSSIVVKHIRSASPLSFTETDAVAQLVELATSCQNVVGSIPALGVGSLPVGSVSV